MVKLIKKIKSHVTTKLLLAPDQFVNAMQCLQRTISSTSMYTMINIMNSLEHGTQIANAKEVSFVFRFFLLENLEN